MSMSAKAIARLNSRAFIAPLCLSIIIEKNTVGTTAETEMGITCRHLWRRGSIPGPHLLCPWLMMLVWFPCLAQSGKVFREVNGLVSMEAENASHVNLWRKVKGTSGAAMEALKEGSWNGGVLRFDIEFTQPGSYAVWVLARKGTHSEYGANDVKVWLDRDLSGTPNPGIQNFIRTDCKRSLMELASQPSAVKNRRARSGSVRTLSSLGSPSLRRLMLHPCGRSSSWPASH